MLETLTDLPDFFMKNEKLGSCVRDHEWSEKRESNPRSLKCFESFRDFGVLIGVQCCTESSGSGDVLR